MHHRGHDGPARSAARAVHPALERHDDGLALVREGGAVRVERRRRGGRGLVDDERGVRRARDGDSDCERGVEHRGDGERDMRRDELGVPGHDELLQAPGPDTRHEPIELRDDRPRLSVRGIRAFGHVPETGDLRPRATAAWSTRSSGVRLAPKEARPV